MGSCFLRLLSTSPPFPSSAPGYLCFSFFFTFMNSKEIQPVHPKENQPWIFTGRTDAEAEALTLKPPDEKSQLTRKDPDSGKDWRQKEKRTTEDEMVGWHHWLNGPEFEQTLGVGDGQGGLACCGSRGCREMDWLSDWATTTKHLCEFRNYRMYVYISVFSFSGHLKHLLPTAGSQQSDWPSSCGWSLPPALCLLPGL